MRKQRKEAIIVGGSHCTSRAVREYARHLFLNIRLKATLFWYLLMDFRSNDYSESGMHPEGVIESNSDEVVSTFNDMGLKEELLRGIYAYGFEKLSR